ncbi:DAHL domain-containing protein [Caulobacter segnis]|uniref:DAHL domain-containing protein n=1 Tax=Caulobacter segnis TaxID=88688 RepID=UPI0024104CE8|nr:DAHL domain-containing protein [Caulobacter segnis]
MAGVAALAMIATAAFIYFERIEPATRALAAADHALLDYDAAQARLRRDVVSIRAGLLSNFDPLVEDAARLERALEPLRRDERAPAAAQRHLAELEADIRRQLRLTERIKSDSALIRNSLAYFGAVASEPERFGPAAEELGALSAALLRLSADTAPEHQAAAARRIAELRAAGGDEEAVSQVLAHAVLLLDLLPQTDERVAAVLAERERRARDALRVLVEQGRAKSAASAWWQRGVLLIAVFLLVVLSAEFSVRLSRHMQRLSRRAKLEHAAAQLSADLLNAPAPEVGAVISAALEHLGRMLGAEHARLVGEGVYEVDRAWGDKADCDYSRNVALDRIEDADLAQQTLPDDRRARSAALRQSGLLTAMIRSEDGERAGLVLVRQAGRSWIDVNDAEIARMALGVMAGAVRRLHGERERSALEERLRQAARMEAVGVFASGIAHNFNNVLGAVRGHAEMALARADGDIARHQGEIVAAVDRARQLVDQILAYGARRRAALERVAVTDLLCEAIPLLEAAEKNRGRFVFEVPADEHGVFGDSSELLQLILNLGANAAQASDEGAPIELCVSRRHLPEPRAADDGGLPAGDYVVISIRDSGSGIDPAVRPHIFAPFFTTRPQGNGLGLATVSRTAREHGGGVDVHAPKGGGTQFDVWLPSSHEALRSAAGMGQVLLVAAIGSSAPELDEEQVAELGYEPVAFVDGAAARTAFAEDPSRFDGAIVADRDPAGAVALARTLLAARPDLPVVLSTTAAPSVLALSRAQNRCVACPWPPTPEGLAAALRAAFCAVLDPVEV